MKLHNLLPDSYYIHPRYLSIFRIIYCLIIIFIHGLPSFVWLGNNISYFFFPPGISFANLFNEFPGRAFFLILNLVNIISFFFMFWGLWCSWASVIFSISSIIGHNFIYSLGKVDHTLLYLITPLFLAFTGWGNYYSIDEKRSTHALTNENNKAQVDILITLFAFSIGFSMFTAGVQKLLGGWLNWNAEAVKGHLFSNYYEFGRNKFLAGEFLTLDNHFIWKLMDYSTLIFEIGFLFSVFRRQLFTLFVGMAIFFHLFILLTFNIAFTSNLLAYALFFNWKTIENYINSKQALSYFLNRNKMILLKAVFALSFIVFVVWLFHSNNDSLQKFPSILSLILKHTLNLKNPETIATYGLILISPLFVFLSIYMNLYMKKKLLTKSL